MQGRGLTLNNMLSGSQSSHLKFCQERKLLHVEKGPGEIKVIKKKDLYFVFRMSYLFCLYVLSDDFEASMQDSQAFIR